MSSISEWATLTANDAIAALAGRITPSDQQRIEREAAAAILKAGGGEAEVHQAIAAIDQTIATSGRATGGEGFRPGIDPEPTGILGIGAWVKNKLGTIGVVGSAVTLTLLFAGTALAAGFVYLELRRRR